ncbi:MAG: hypothetical protein WCI73_05585, partial [Phycisphaerae bacterium]
TISADAGLVRKQRTKIRGSKRIADRIGKVISGAAQLGGRGGIFFRGTDHRVAPGGSPGLEKIGTPEVPV